MLKKYRGLTIDNTFKQVFPNYPPRNLSMPTMHRWSVIDDVSTRKFPRFKSFGISPTLNIASLISYQRFFMTHVNVFPSHLSPMPIGYRQFPEYSSWTIDAILLHFFLMPMIHRWLMIIITTWSFFCSDFSEAKNKYVGHNFSSEFLVKMSSSF
jgi:hypothetical protein